VGQFELSGKEKARLIQTFKGVGKIGVFVVVWAFDYQRCKLDAEIGNLAL
jgi:hypothetical protein